MVLTYSDIDTIRENEGEDEKTLFKISKIKQSQLSFCNLPHSYLTFRCDNSTDSVYAKLAKLTSRNG